MSKPLTSRAGTGSPARRSLTFVCLLLAGLWAAAGLAPTGPRVVNSQDGGGGAARALSFEERVGFQRALDEADWRRAVWPEVNGGEKPALAEVLTAEETAAKVEDTLRKSEALARLWGRAVTPEQLQAEVERMARETKRPEVLRELWQALGDDPLVVAELLARPALVERLAREAFASDERFHGATRARAEEALRAHATPGGMRQMGGRFSEATLVRVARKSSGAALTRLELTADEWAAETARLGEVFGERGGAEELPTGLLSELREDDRGFYVTAVVERAANRLKVARVDWPKTGFDEWWAGARGEYAPAAAPSGDFNYRLPPISQAAAGADDTWTPMSALPVTTGTVVWTGTEMIVWGGGLTNSGSRYNPATDTWRPTSTINAPQGRRGHTAVWTGTEMIVWGGCGPKTDFCGLKTGGRYNPQTDTWTPTTLTNAPNERAGHTAVWTGSRMIVWGGCMPQYRNQCSLLFGGGSAYDPAADTWTPISATNAPSPRAGHTAVWTGAEMIVWGPSTNTGGRYDPATDSWRPMNTFNAPSARAGYTMIWTGSEVIVWGGFEPNFVPFNTGGRYNPQTDTWTPTTTAGAPSARYYHTAVWTGAEMIVYGGESSPTTGYLNTGGRYDPSTDTWRPTSTAGAPPKSQHVAVWTGAEMIVWSTSHSKSGGRYDPATDSWRPTNNSDSPPASSLGVWTGTELIVWGIAPGCSNVCESVGGRYNPATNSWRPMNVAGAAPPGSYGVNPPAVWTGTEMVVWGESYTTTTGPGDGGRYNPQTDTWRPMTNVGAPTRRQYHTAVWTGSEVVFWGGAGSSPGNTGGRYNPTTDSWRPTSTAGAPAARYYHSAVWDGSRMIVWGGIAQSGGNTNTGGRYDPQADAWTPTSTAGAPAPRAFHTALWTGAEMIVWGGRTGDYSSTAGIFGNGARYNPATDAWTPISNTSAPAPRFTHGAVWTGSLMIVWGGQVAEGIYTGATYTGARYDPSSDLWAATETKSAASRRFNHVQVWTGDSMLVWGGWADEGAATHGAIYFAPRAAPGNTPPAVRITAPANGSAFQSGDNVRLDAEATDSDGSVTAVRFYAGETLVGTDTTAPYSITWNEVRGGSYTLTATASDDGGALTRSGEVQITVAPSTAPPTCVLKSPADGAVYTTPSNIQFLAEAQANRDRTISTVEFYKGSELIVTSRSAPHSFNYGGLPPGTYVFHIRCTDSAGAAVTSPNATVAVRDPSTLHVSGKIVDGEGLSLSGIRVRLDSPQGPQYQTTGASGTYGFTGLQSGAGYTVTPESTAHTFTPASRNYPSLTQSDDAADFTSSRVRHVITGRITDASGAPLYPATVNLSGSATRTTGTDVNGVYRFFNLTSGGTYTLQPYKNQYSFDPPFVTFSNLSADQTADFNASPTVPAPAAEVVWVEDSLPAGATPLSNNETWQWTASNPDAYAGASAHQSAAATGFHNHYFHSAAQTLTVGAGDVLYTYVYVEPGNVPATLMLQWNDGTQWRNAYWGADQINWVGARVRIGDVPAAGQWTRLEVPASALGLGGKTVSGMAFNLWGGKASWDQSGKLASPAPPSGEQVWVEDAVPAGAIEVGNNETWEWVTSGPAPHSGASAHRSANLPGFHNHYFHSAAATLNVGAGDVLYAYVYLDPASIPSELMLQWNDGTNWRNAYWGTDQINWVGARVRMGDVPAAGQWTRLEVPAAALGLEGKTLSGMAFNLWGGRATWDKAGKVASTTPPPAAGVWVEDGLPAGAVTASNNEDWSWVSSNPTPFSGALAHQSAVVSGFHNHYFHSAAQTLAVNAGDRLYAYVYIDPANVPSEIMLQWNDGTAWRNAYWGSDQINWVGARTRIGDVPAAGQWVRLEVPAATLGLEGKTLTGMAFNLWGGRVTWDKAGKD